MPIDINVLSLFALFHALVARVGKHIGFLAVHQRVRLCHIVDVGRRAHHGMHQSRFGVHADVRFHPEVPLVALLGQVHLGVALARAVLG
ncbi:hypothetical protein D9M69_627720 [compost metagenome]